jgi:ribosome biogenesis GTPase
MNGVVTKSTGSWYQVRLQDGTYCDARLRGKFKLSDKKITNPIAVGDRVEVHIDGDTPIIENIENRDNYVVRASPRKRGHSHLIAANLDQAAVIASFKLPKTSLGFIDRFFVTLETFRIPGILIMNKKDIYSAEEMKTVESICELYDRIGYQTHLVSLIEEGDSGIRQVFQNKTTLLSGHSGTGKSTLINLLHPHAKQEINEVSTFANKGVHTTTFAEMFSLDGDTFIIDTPGIKELGLAEIEPEELSHYFPEMRNLLGTCKFNNCLHVNEPGCSVTEAVASGEISAIRYKSYLSMLLDEESHR